jgi:hypothetical protein
MCTLCFVRSSTPSITLHHYNSVRAVEEGAEGRLAREAVVRSRVAMQQSLWFLFRFNQNNNDDDDIPQSSLNTQQRSLLSYRSYWTTVLLDVLRRHKYTSPLLSNSACSFEADFDCVVVYCFIREWLLCCSLG